MNDNRYIKQITCLLTFEPHIRTLIQGYMLTFICTTSITQEHGGHATISYRLQNAIYD